MIIIKYTKKEEQAHYFELALLKIIYCDSSGIAFIPILLQYSRIRGVLIAIFNAN